MPIMDNLSNECSDFIIVGLSSASLVHNPIFHYDAGAEVEKIFVGGKTKYIIELRIYLFKTWGHTEKYSGFYKELSK